MIKRRDFLKGMLVTVSALGLGNATKAMASQSAPFTNIMPIK